MDERISRRGFLLAAGGGAAALTWAACGAKQANPPADKADKAVSAHSAAVDAAEAKRRVPGAQVHDLALRAAPLTLGLGYLKAQTWGYNGSVPAYEIRLKAGDVLRAKLTNDIAQPTVVHWHGIALRNDMDGVPDVTQASVATSKTFVYEFTVPDPGTYWFHPHHGLQLDRGLYGPLIVEDPHEPGRYDRELTIIVDDWIDGIGNSPEKTLALLEKNGMGMNMSGMGAMQMPSSPLLGGDAGDVNYPLFLMNGKPPQDPTVFDAKPGERLRLRIINAGADTAFRVSLGGHRLTVTHTDGFPVQPVITDSLLIGMAERYDVIVTVAGAGVFPLVALAEGKGGQALGLLRTGAGAMPPLDVRPDELDRQLLDPLQLKATEAVNLPLRPIDRTYILRLGGPGSGRSYRWTINGKAVMSDSRLMIDGAPITVRQGERVRLIFENDTTMFHPMHLHGHTFQLMGSDNTPGPRKDTTIVRPKQRITVDVQADNPGQWMLHCHNIYHQEAGMMTLFSYIK